MRLDRAWPGIFTPAEAEMLSALQMPPEACHARQRLVRADAPQSDSLYLTQGLLGRYRSDRLGRRQFLGLQIPGDYIDLPAYVLKYTDHDIDAITDAVMRRTPHDNIRALRGKAPDTYEKLWRISLVDASIHRYWIFRLGRLAGRAQIANFFCEMLLRLYSRGLCGIEGFELPITQTDLAECCGMTPVHANRMVAELREEGICTFAQGYVQIGKLPELFQMGQYSWDYLYLAPELDREIRERVTGRSRQAPRSDTLRLRSAQRKGPA